MNNIEAALNENGFKGRANWKGEMPLQFCPFHRHNHRSPSLSLNIKNGYKCYSCGEKGSIWRFLDAVGIESFFDRGGYSVDDIWKILNDEVDSEEDILTPLDDSRAIECAGWYHDYWQSRGFDEQFCRNNRLGYNSKRLRVTIPVYFRGGYYGSLQRTVLEDEKPKYLIPQNFQRRKLVYEPITDPQSNVKDDSKKDILLITEGSIDALKANLFGYNSVATLGCMPSREQIEIVMNRPERKKILAFDNDDAGKSSLEIWMKTNYPFHVMQTRAKDIAESDKEDVDRAVADSMDLLEYQAWQI
jgi:DNA primase